MGLLNNSNAIESGGYNIDRSLRFRSSASAYLNRTPASTTNRRTFTWSGWVKRGTLGVQNFLFSSVGSTGDSGVFHLFFGSGDNLVCGGGTNNWRTTTQVFRDPSAWYHIVLKVDTTDGGGGGRMVLYVNGQQITAYTGTDPALNLDTAINVASYPHTIGKHAGVATYFDGYLAEVNFIDGQALTPSSFGQTDAVTGVWVPKKYTGTYGTNGFYLPFSDNTSATTLAYDKSGNGNNWTANNISTTAGATYDSMTDVPTLTSATAANFATLNPLQLSGIAGFSGAITKTFSNANLNITLGTGSYAGITSTIAIPTSGKWYWEAATTSNKFSIGISAVYGENGFTAETNVRVDNTNIYANGSAVQSGLSGYTTEVIGVAWDADIKTMQFYKNGSAYGSAQSYTPSAGATYYPFVLNNSSSLSSVGWVNFGQRPFSYTPPTGFKALNTFNLPDPTIKKPNQYMDATLYTGTGANQSITNSGSMQPDMVWIKDRSAARVHNIQDSVRGVRKWLESNSTSAEGDSGSIITAFNSNGFSLNDALQVNASGETYVSWQWKKGATPGFDIVTYTGTGTTANNVAHSLGVAPKMIIVKPRNQVEAWNVYHESLGNTKAVFLHLTNAATTSQYLWNNTSPTSSVFTVSTTGAGYTNQSGINYVAYLFAEIPGYSKFGSYTGNGSANGPFVYCGFRPRWVMIKCTDSGPNFWSITDTARDTYNTTTKSLYPNDAGAESTSNFNIDVTANGFKPRSTSSDINVSGGTYVFMAFAENPFKYSNAR